MDINVEKRGNAAVLTLGKTDIGDVVENALREHLDSLVAEQQIKYIVVDLEQVKWMTSSAFGLLIAAQNALRPRNGAIYLARPRDRVISAFSIMQLERLFKRFDTVEEALSAINTLSSPED